MVDMIGDPDGPDPEVRVPNRSQKAQDTDSKGKAVELIAWGTQRIERAPTALTGVSKRSRNRNDCTQWRR